MNARKKMATNDRSRILLLAACLACASVHAEMLPYENDNQRFGAALVVPLGRRDLVKKNMEYCADAFPDMKWNAQMAYARWIRRQAGFLSIATSMTRGITEAAAKDGTEKGAQMKKLLDYIAKQIEKLSDTQVEMIAGMPSEEVKRGTCAKIVASVDLRYLDIENTDPDMTKYLLGIGEKYRVKMPDPGAGSASESPDARKDAAALLGKWRGEKVIYHMADGTIREGPGGCTVEFSEQRLVSECQGGGRQFRVVYSYLVRDAGRYESEILENKAYPSLVGTRAIAAFRVEGGKLLISAFPSTVNAEPARPVEVESVSVRDATSGGSSQ